MCDDGKKHKVFQKLQKLLEIICEIVIDKYNVQPLLSNNILLMSFILNSFKYLLKIKLDICC